MTVAILVWLAVRREWRWLGHPGVVAVGIGSYGVYLWQELFLNPRQHEWWTAFPQNVLLVALVAFVSYRVIERPFLRLKDRTGPARSGDGFANATVKTNNRCETDPTRHLSLTRA